jgi:glycosyltransferase involved in cell wall biosynthesis
MDTSRAPTGLDEQPRVGVVIPAYNAERYVGEAIESVLAQTYGSVDCVVVDDGSTDGTAEVARTYAPEVRLVAQKNAGVAAARNRGAAAAEGPLLAFLDADDVWLPAKLERQVRALQASPEAGVVLCGLSVTDAHLTPTGMMNLDPSADLMARLILLDGLAMVGMSQAAVVRRERFDALGGFDIRFGTSADWHFLLRLLRQSSWAYVKEPLVLYRVHGDNMSRNVEATEHDMLLGFEELFGDPMLEPELRALRSRAYGNLHRLLAGSYFVAGRHREFLRHTLASVRHDPTELAYFARWPGRRLRRICTRIGSDR